MPSIHERPGATTFALLLALTPVAASAPAQETTLASVAWDGALGDASSGSEGVALAIDASGHRLVFFCSYATNLVPGDAAGVKDLFLRDVDAGTTERVVLGIGGAEPDSDVIRPAPSADGRFVAFTSWATNLVIGDTNGLSDVFLLDRATGIVELVSVDRSGGPADGSSNFPSVSDDGRYVAFQSDATDLVKAGVDGNGTTDVFVRDRALGATVCASVDALGFAGNGRSTVPAGRRALSYDGRRVLFTSLASNFVAADLGDGNGVSDAFLRDLVLGATDRISVDDGGGELGAASVAVELSPKGTIALFRTGDVAALPGFSNGALQVYARVLSGAGLLPAVARHDGSPLPTQHPFVDATIAGDEGSDFDPLVAFVVAEDGVVPGSPPAEEEVYVRRLHGGEVQRASVRSDGTPGLAVSPWMYHPALSRDGDQVAFMAADAYDPPADSNGSHYDVYLRGLCWTLFTEYGAGLAGSGGFVPGLRGTGSSCEEGAWSVHVESGLGGTSGTLWASLGDSAGTPLFGGSFFLDWSQLILALPITLSGPAGVAGAGSLELPGEHAEGLGNLELHLQATLIDRAAPRRVSITNALTLSVIDTW